ncbi:hypothetical protein Acav_0243 [Paracidovorax avenae ATCC 19860]|uniref:Uncharacterized protein n=1 Tax=Paracidovorax avenae (strain ATCC 19860 / DSM 7227 / CCUG 15838 / JCM 20985 / LMG 2117 / NCPPB 1011) TaxID=643561 RepID=F0Q2R0_PARA1|nr:hypothetical protein [Paracidovorax avenae]ADX44169.1 hypothetical protein Acav_0243 [Paracidovorax avenae ATCC 19860]AVS65127.1 hypothetical protein C8245_04900 [Paracidovorax avenae]
MNDSPLQKTDEASPETTEAPIQEARLWSDGRWTAEVIKNEDDDGWAVAMTLRGESEPALVGPWTMGRDKKNPKPLDVAAFHTLVKTASEVLRRHEQQLHAQLHKEVAVGSGADLVRVALRIVPDEEYPYAVLTAHGAAGQLLGEARVEANFKLSQGSALAWIESDYSPRGR